LQNLYRDPLGSIRAWQRSRIRFEKHGDRSLSIPGMVSVSKDPSYFRSLRIDERFFSFHPLAQSALDAVHCPLSNINSAKRRIFVARKFLTNSLRNSLSLSLSLSFPLPRESPRVYPEEEIHFASSCTLEKITRGSCERSSSSIEIKGRFPVRPAEIRLRVYFARAIIPFDANAEARLGLFAPGFRIPRTCSEYQGAKRAPSSLRVRGIRQALTKRSL